MANITLCCYKMENEIHLLTIATQSVIREFLVEYLIFEL